MKFFVVVLLLVCVLTGNVIPESEMMDIRNAQVESYFGVSSGDFREINWSIEGRQATLHKGVLPNSDYIKIENMSSYSQSGHPQVPGEIIKVSLPDGIRVMGAEIVSGKYARLEGRYDIPPMPEQFPRREEYRNSKIEYKRCPDIFNSDELYPGKWMKTWGGTGAGGGRAYLLIMPVQYNPVSQETILLKEASFRIYYQTVENRLNRTGSITETLAENIIIAPEEFGEQANRLIDAHTVHTEFVSLEYISENYEPIDFPFDFPHYNRTALPWYFERYDLYLPLRIIAFLSDFEAHPNLRNITILGDSHIIPPSFYSNFGDRDHWDDFIPSDFLYASPNLDLVPNFGVSRLPASNVEQADSMITNIISWLESADPERFSNVFFTGGLPFNNYYFDDEMTPINIINSGNTMGFNITKSFATRGGFTKESFISEWSTGNYGVVYEMGHGSGYAISFDNGEIFGVDDFYLLPANDFAPIHFVGVCSNGLFDDDLITTLLPGNTYCEAAMLAPGGAIAVFSATRTSFGTPSYYFDDAKLKIESENYISDMGFRLMQTLNRRPDDLGSLMLETIEAYIASNDMTTWRNLYTLYEFIFIGDAAVSLPFVPLTEPNPGLSVSYPAPSRSHLDFVVLSGSAGEYLAFTPFNTSSFYDVGLSRVFYNGYRDTSAHIGHGASYHLSIPHHSESVRLDIEDEYAQEQRFYFWISGSRMFIDGLDLEWSTTPLAASDPVNFDEPAYELTELYIRDDAENYYFAYPFFDGYGPSRSYNLAIDSKPGGYTGSVEGRDFDHFGNHVFFGGGFEVDFIISQQLWSWPAYDFYRSRQAVGVWDDGAWSRDYFHIGDVGGEIAHSIDDEGMGFVEIRMPKSTLGNYDSIAVILYSCPIDNSGMNYYPAQDAVPTDPATFDTFTEGYNTLTSFHIFRSGDRVFEAPNRPETTRAIKAFPNPFNSGCEIIAYGLNPEIRIFDISGKLIERLKTNEGRTIWKPAEDVNSGLYIAVSSEGSTVLFYIR